MRLRCRQSREARYGLIVALWVTWTSPVVFAQTTPDESSSDASEAEWIDCTDLSTSILRIARELERVQLESALEEGRAALRTLECQNTPVDPLLLHELFQLLGAVHLYAGDESGAVSAFEWAVVISPSTALSSSYGRSSQELYERVHERVLAEPLAFLTVTGEVEAWIDGRSFSVGSAQEVRPGNHLVQWRLAGGEVHSRVIEILEGEPRTLPLGGGVTLPEESSPLSELVADIEGTVPRPSASRVLFLGTGLTSMTGGAILVSLAARAHREFYSESDPERLLELQTRTNTLAATGLVLMASGLAVGTFSITLGAQFAIHGRF